MIADPLPPTALHHIIEKTANKTGPKFFQTCVQLLAEYCQMDYALIGEVVGEYQNEVNLLALWGDGQLQENHFYHLSENPCATPFLSVGEEMVEDCCSFLPWQEPWLTPGLKGSVCKVLYGVNGEVLGLLALMDKRPQVDLSPDQDIILRIF
ncbi:MAG: hypothetical protein VKK07_07700, partial [Merismopediaceae bacterium]|nr:hypothetical protein [Merismopediaceae bacterium]